MSDAQTLTVPASRFIAAEVNKFSRSHTRVYLALILDVIHAHNAVKPAGYAAMLTELAPQCNMWAKYCTVIAPALAGVHATTLAEFPATVDGLTKAVAWYENQAKKADYSLSLEDMVRFFKGQWSVKAQRDQAKQESDKITATAVAARAAAAVAETARRAAADTDHNIGRTLAQVDAEQSTPRTPLALVSGSVTPGPVLGEGWQSHMVIVHTKGDDVRITGLDTLSPEHLLSMMENLNTFMLAAINATAAAEKAA